MTRIHCDKCKRTVRVTPLGITEIHPMKKGGGKPCLGSAIVPKKPR